LFLEKSDCRSANRAPTNGEKTQGTAEINRTCLSSTFSLKAHASRASGPHGESKGTALARKNLLKIKQVAEMLQISVHTAYKWAESGRLPAVKLGYSLRFDPDRIEKFIANGETA
jgi:excisionase family DNA binding protein